MPAKLITVKAKNKDELKKRVIKSIKDAGKKGLIYVKSGYDERRVKRVKDGYEIEIQVHS